MRGEGRRLEGRGGKGREGEGGKGHVKREGTASKQIKRGRR